MEKMIKIDDVEISESTVKAALKSVGIKLEKEYIPKAGDIIETELGRRIIVEEKEKFAGMTIDGKIKTGFYKSLLVIYDKMRKVGELKDLL